MKNIKNKKYSLMYYLGQEITLRDIVDLELRTNYFNPNSYDKAYYIFKHPCVWHQCKSIKSICKKSSKKKVITMGIYINER